MPQDGKMIPRKRKRNPLSKKQPKLENEDSTRKTTKSRARTTRFSPWPSLCSWLSCYRYFTCTFRRPSNLEAPSRPEFGFPNVDCSRCFHPAKIRTFTWVRMASSRTTIQPKSSHGKSKEQFVIRTMHHASQVCK